MSDEGETPDGDEEEAAEIASEIDRVVERLGEAVQEVFRREGVRHQSMAMALVGMAAHHVLHDGANEEDLVRIAHAGWERAREVHAKECAS